MTPEDYRAAAQRACYRADVRIENWRFEDDRMELTVASEHGQKWFGATGLHRSQMNALQFEDYVYRSVIDWTI